MVKVLTYRYYWELVGDTKINMKIVTDTERGHEDFISALKNLDNLQLASREYLQEYDLEKITGIEKLFDIFAGDSTTIISEVIKNEEN